LAEEQLAQNGCSIVAVHGLNGHRENTWTSEGGKLWLRDFLPSKISNVRIYSWGYDANTHSGDRVNTQYIYDIAKTLVSDLSLARQLTNTEQRPIIFVAHSLGGLVVKSVG
jgi:predicted alpha/beta-fold hydrolase